MKYLAFIVFSGTFILLSGCGADGVVIGDPGGPTVRTTPIPHYILPSDNALGFINVSLIPLTPPVELGPGHDLWALWFDEGQSSDNPSVAIPPATDWEEALTTGWIAPGGTTPTGPPGPTWPWFGATPPPPPPLPGPARTDVQTWVLSIVNQHFFRDVDGSALPGTIIYESVPFTSHLISIVDERTQTTPGFVTGGSPYGIGEQNQLIDPAATVGTGNNGYTQVLGPVSNIVNFAYDGGNGNPVGSIIGVCFVEAFGINAHIESNVGRVATVPHPIVGGTAITDTDAGILVRRFVDLWVQVAFSNGAVDQDDGGLFAYYLAVIAAHVIGNGVGLANSTFALPIGTISNQDDIMNRSVVLDMSALIAAGKQFQFVSTDHFTLASTLPGQFR